jgi:hypothetical protein
LARSAAAEAVSLLRRGLTLVPALPDSDRRRETELGCERPGDAIFESEGCHHQSLVLGDP